MNFNKTVLIAFRTGVTAGIGVLLWLSSSFVQKEAFQDYKLAHERYGDTVIQRIDGDVNDLKASASRIEAKLDKVLEIRRASVETGVGKR